MASASASLTSLTCPICTEAYSGSSTAKKLPKNLTCGHTFCEACVGQMGERDAAKQLVAMVHVRMTHRETGGTHVRDLQRYAPTLVVEAVTVEVI